MRDVMKPDELHIQIQVMSPLDALGGGAVHACGIAGALRRRGVRASLLCTGDPDERDDREFGRVVTARPPRLPLLWRWPAVSSLPHWVRTIRRTARDADGIVSLSPVLAAASRRALPGVPLVYCPAALHAFERAGKPPGFLERCEGAALRKSDAVLFPADEVREAAGAGAGPQGPRHAVCPLGIDESRVRPGADPRPEFGIPPEATVLLTVGSINENKGQRRIARALAEIRRDDWWWVIVGDGPDRSLVAAELRGSPFADRTVFVGNVERVGDWYAAADVLVAASRYETFGLACAEALWSGLPIVIPQNQRGRVLSPLADAVETRGLGRTFDRDDPAALLRVLTELADDAELRAAIGREARAYARRRFSWSRYGEHVLELLGVDVPCGHACAREVFEIRPAPIEVATATAPATHSASGGVTS